jgi:hypothetical protein
MKAQRVHYFFAQEWPIKIWMTSFSSVFGFWAASGLWPLLVSPTKWMDPLVFLGCVLLAALLGYFVSILVGWPVIGIMYYDRSLKNGEPFHKGDLVQILVGPHRDCVVPVIEAYDYASFAGAHRICVDLGPDVKDNVFRSTQIVRVSTGKDEEQEDRQPNETSHATSEPAPGTASSAREGGRSGGESCAFA